MSVASTAASVDWQLVAAAVGTFITAVWATYKGYQKGKEKVSDGSGSVTSIIGGTLMDNMSMRDLTDALRANTEAIRDQTHELQRHNDLVIMIGRLPQKD